MEIHLDNCSLSELVKGTTSVEAFLAFSSRAHGRVYVSKWSLDELFSTPDDGFVHSAAELLSKFLGRGWFRLASTISDICIAELAGQVSSTPTISHARRQTYATICAEIARASAPTALVEHVRRLKNEGATLHELKLASWTDHIRREFAQHSIGARDVAADAVRLSPKTIPEWLLVHLFRQRLGRTNADLAEVREQPRRYRAALTWCGLVYLHMIGAGTAPQHRTMDATLLRALAPDRNDFLDAQIAGEAAHGDLLVSEDRRLRQRCNMLHATGCVGFRAVSLAELLGSKSDEPQAA